GIAPETVDEAALAFGMPMGPIELADTVGLDICMAVGKMLKPDVEPPAKLKALVDAGQLGKKTKRGFYDWSSGKAAKQPAGAVPAGLAERVRGPVLSGGGAGACRRRGRCPRGSRRGSSARSSRRRAQRLPTALLPMPTSSMPARSSGQDSRH